MDAKDTIQITGVWLRATTDQRGRETVAVDLEIEGEWVTVIREPGGTVAQQDNGANISHAASPSGIRRAAAHA